MRAIPHQDLPQPVAAELTSRQASLNWEMQNSTTTSHSKLAAKHWADLQDAAKKDILSTLRAMTGDWSHCMYCERNCGKDIEHHRPKSKFPALCFSWDNLLLACPECNRDFKRDNWIEGFPNPRGAGFSFWAEVDFDPLTGGLYPTTESMRLSLEILGMVERKGRRSAGKVRADLAKHRALHLSTVSEIAQRYALARTRSDDNERRSYAQRLFCQFPSLTLWFLHHLPAPVDPEPPIMAEYRKISSAINRLFPDAWEDIIERGCEPRQ